MRNGAVLVFARAPERGRVKTRLHPLLGPHGALSVYRAFLEDTLVFARAAAATVVLAHTPSRPFREQRLADFHLVQRGDGFGARFDAALEDAAGLLPARTPLVVVGADTPHLGAHGLRAAFRALRRAPSVIGFSPRGGFHLLGFRGPPVAVAQAFDGPNEGATVRRLLADAGSPAALVDPSFDVDEPSDLVRLLRQIRGPPLGNGGWVPDRTRRVLLTMAPTIEAWKRPAPPKASAATGRAGPGATGRNRRTTGRGSS